MHNVNLWPKVLRGLAVVQYLVECVVMNEMMQMLGLNGYLKKGFQVGRNRVAHEAYPGGLTAQGLSH